MPIVSIITPLLNKGPHVEETVRSVQAQTFGDWGMIVVDNGSRDGGPHRVRKWTVADRRIQLVSSAKHGPGAARSSGLAQAAG